MIVYLTIYLMVGLFITVWADKESKRLYGKGCPSWKAGLSTMVLWLPIVMTALFAIYYRR